MPEQKRVRIRKTGTTKKYMVGDLEVTLGPAVYVEWSPAPTKRPSLTERFEQFHGDNPDFYRELVDLTREYLAETGSTKVGIQMVIEVARWKSELKTKTADFRINNDFAAFYARLIMHQEDDLFGVFEVRRSDEAEKWISTLEAPAPRKIRKVRVGRRVALRRVSVNPVYL